MHSRYYIRLKIISPLDVRGDLLPRDYRRNHLKWGLGGAGPSQLLTWGDHKLPVPSNFWSSNTAVEVTQYIYLFTGNASSYSACAHLSPDHGLCPQ